MRATCSVCGVALHVPAKALRRQAYDATCSANIPGSTESRVGNAASQYTCAADVRVPRNSRPTQHHKTCQPSGAKLQSLHRHILVSTCVSARAHGSHAAKSGERVPAPHGAPRPATARTSCLCPCPPTRHRKQMVLLLQQQQQQPRPARTRCHALRLSANRSAAAWTQRPRCLLGKCSEDQ